MICAVVNDTRWALRIYMRKNKAYPPAASDLKAALRSLDAES